MSDLKLNEAGHVAAVNGDPATGEWTELKYWPPDVVPDGWRALTLDEYETVTDAVANEMLEDLKAQYLCGGIEIAPGVAFGHPDAFKEGDVAA